MPHLIIPLLAAAASVLSTAAADVLHVPGDYPTIQAGIDAAMDGDEVIVADGVYTGEGNRDLDFGGKLITVRSENGPDNCIIDCQGTQNDPHRGFYFHSGETNDAVVDGFTIANGYATAASPGGPRGGGMYNSNSSPTVNNCTFTDNTAVIVGGGMYNSDFSSPTVSDCTFSGNTAVQRGGGIFNWFSSLTVTDCTFNSNTAIGDDGGGIYTASSTVEVRNSTFVGNSATSNGGAMINYDSTVAITDCTYSGNISFGTSGTGGGAVINFDSDVVLIGCELRENQALLGGAVASASAGDGSHTIVMIDCFVVDNVATSGGGALFNQGDYIGILINCTVDRNAAAGAFSRGGGVYNQFGSSSIWINVRATGNSAQSHGGAVYNHASGTFSLVNSTLSNNSAGQFGGGIYNAIDQGSGAIHNSILWANNDIGGSDESAQIHVNAGEVSVDFSCIEGLTGKLGGTGNIGDDPLFIDPANDDYRLLAGSPCIDAADNTAVPKEIDTDLDGNPRFVDDPDTKDTGFGDPPIVDMGAYEFQVRLCPWDLDNNAVVGVSDLLSLLGSWGPCPPKGDCPADFDNSGDVGVKDLLILLGNWGPCP